ALKYVPVAAAGGLLLHVISDWLTKPRRRVPSTVAWFFVFLGFSLFSLAINWTTVGMALLGVKCYFPLWALFLGLALLRWRPGVIDSLPKAALVLAVLQLPFVAHQVLFLVPMRQGLPNGVVPEDIIAGTFGGDIYGGGANAVLTLFMIMVAAC